MPNHATDPAVAMIPARLGSTRFPRKMLADDTGIPLVVHTMRAALRSERASRVVVATDDQAIASAVRHAGGEAVMTSADHPNGSSRLAEAADLLGLADETIVVNVQGDEPEIEARLIDLAIDALIASGADAATVASPFAHERPQDPADPNIVKVVTDCRGRALYFSRNRIPFDLDGRAESAGSPETARPLRHVGLYAYRAGFLREYVALPATPLERTERLEQLRILEHGYAIAVAVAESSHAGIDTPEQYAEFVKRWRTKKR